MGIYFYSSPIGVLKIKLKQRAVESISKTSVSKSSRGCLNSQNGKINDNIKVLFHKLNQYFSGRKVAKWPIHLTPQGTVFQNQVWNFLKTIPCGKVKTYKQVAAGIGCPKSFRAVGSACGKNPWLIVVPCHRVVSQKGLGGFALGLKIKTYLLGLEKPL